jgi:hypothetical protein
MRTQDDYDVHADLRQKVAELGRHLVEIEARLWQLKDAFYVHTHGDEGMQAMVKEHMLKEDPDLRDASKRLEEAANR